MLESLKLTGHVKIWQEGKLICDSRNRIVDTGLELIARLLLAEEGAKLPSLFKLGDSAALSTQAMTGLQGATLVSCPATAERRVNVLSWSGSFTYAQANQVTCRELGLFNEEEPEVMLARFLPVQQFVLQNGTPVKINWEIIIGE